MSGETSGSSNEEDWRPAFDDLVSSGSMRRRWLHDWLVYLEPNDSDTIGTRDFCPPSTHSLDLTTYHTYRDMLYGESGE